MIDIVVLLVADMLAPLMLLASTGGHALPGRGHYAVASIAGTVATQAVLARWNVYRLASLQCQREQLHKAAVAVVLGAMSLVAVLVALESPYVIILAYASAWVAAAFLCLAGARIAAANVIDGWSRAGRLARRVAVIGATPISERLIRDMQDARAPAVDIIGVFDDQKSRVAPVLAGVPVVGNVDELLARSRNEVLDSVIIGLPMTAKARIGQILAQLEDSVADIHVMVDLNGLQRAVCSVEPLARELIVGVSRRPLKDWDAFVKRSFDLLVGGALLAAAAPVMLAIALLIKLNSPGPVFFRQKRYGFNNNTIDVLKFRTMHHHLSDPLADRLTQRDDARITPLGKWLRRWSLDELPQVFNVLRGDMSLVGPRPHALHAKAANRLYADAVEGYARRHRVKPGITGWAQVNGWRGETETIEQIENRVAHDLYYIEHWSIWLDIRILRLTAWREFWSRNAF